MIARLDPINYDKPFKTNELVERGRDEASLITAKINEIIDTLNGMEKALNEFLKERGVDVGADPSE